MKKTCSFAIFFFFLVLLLGAGAGCSMDNPFAELESSELLTDAQRQLATTEWHIDYGQTTTYADYVQVHSVTAAEAGTTAGLPTAYVDDIHRLSITNLIPNGDFESALSADWSTVGGAIAAIATAPAQTNTLGEALYSGNVLHFTITDPSTARIELDLDTAAPPTGSFVSTGSYLIRFDFSDSGAGDKYFQMQGFENGSWVPDVTPNTIYSVPHDYSGIDTYFQGDPAANIFTIGTTIAGQGGGMDGYMDNLRMLRTDIENRIVLEVPWSAGGTRPDLVSGFYRFSLYIKNIPPAELPPNEFQSKSVTLGISNTSGGLNSIYNQAVHQSNDAGANWDEWTQISVDSFLQVDKPATDPNDPVIFLCITPTNVQSAPFKDVGSILIAAPGLRYSSDGTF
jgi:hypothetical protein